MKKKSSYKEVIPNILTASRIVFTPIIIALGFFKYMNLVIALVIFAAITDFFDGYLARKWNVVSLKGAKMDAVADKVFVIGLIAALCRNYPILLIPFGLEIIIGLSNLVYHYKKDITKSLFIGKIKTCFLFATVVLGFIVHFYNSLQFLFNGFLAVTINLQILSIFAYFAYYLDYETVDDSALTILDTVVDEENEPTILLNDLQDFIEEIDFEHLD